MKKLSAILLIALFLFNLVGYRLVFNYEQRQYDISLEASLDKQEYNDADLITIKVPLSLPYVNNQLRFERINGEININGKILKYVKRKITDGSLVLLCLPDHNKMRIESAKDEFFKYANDLVQNNQSKKSDHSKSGSFKNLLSEYYIDASDNHLMESIIKPAYFSNSGVPFLSSSYTHLPEQPPEVV